MSGSTPLLDSSQANPQTTLGDLLYRNPPDRRISEGAWLALVQAIAGRDAGALKALYELSHRLVFTLAIRIVNNRATAEELTLDVFHEIWRRSVGYDPAEGTVVGWIMNLTRARSIDRLRSEQRPERTTSTEYSMQQREIGRRLRAALTALTADERAAIEMVYFSDSTYAEVSHRLDTPLGTIKTRIRTGMAKLRFALTRNGVP
jgi:RNA polymerase sigma-70 factor (ECF subfamily)